jgi:hypothetical protein
MGNWKQETRNKKRETRNEKQETRNKILEMTIEFDKLNCELLICH